MTVEKQEREGQRMKEPEEPRKPTGDEVKIRERDKA